MPSLRSLLSFLTVLSTAHHSFASSTVDIQHTVTPGSQPAVDESVFLRPAIDLQLNIYDYASLTPTTSHRFYYATNQGGRLHQVWVNYVFDMPLIALDHTAYIQQLRCFGPGGKHMIIQFSTKKAYNMALGWGKKMPMILSGYWHDGCNPKDAHAERYYAYASAVHTHPGLRELKFDVRFMSIHEVTQEMEINIGHPSGINKPTTSLKPTPLPSSTISYPAHVTSTLIPTTRTVNYLPPTLPTPKTPDTTLEDFDVALDDKIGYWTDFGDAFTNQVFPGTTFSASKRDYEFEERTIEERAPPKVTAPKAPVSIPKAPITVPKAPVTVPKAPITVPKAPATVPKAPVTVPKVPVTPSKVPAVVPKVPVAVPKPSSFSPTSLLKTALNTAKAAVTQAAAAPLSQLTQTLKTAATSALAAPLKAITNAVANVIPPINLTPINTIWAWTLPPKALTPSLTQTPFGGTGVKFYEWSRSSASVQGNANVAAYCINCAVNGTFTIVGTLKANPLALKVEQAQLKISGPMMINAEIGVVFNGGVAVNFKKSLYSVPVNSFTIPGILEIGPKFSLDLNAALTSSMGGQISIGQTAAWSPDFAATLDLLHPLSSSVVNYKNTLTPFVHMNAALSLNMQGGASIGVPVTASLFKGKISYQAGMFAAVGLSTTLQADVQKGVPRVVRRDVTYELPPGTGPHVLGLPAPAIAARQDDSSPDASPPAGSDAAADASVAASANLGPSCNGVFVGMTGFKSLYFAADGLGTKSFWGTTSTMGHWCQTRSGAPVATSAPVATTTAAPTTILTDAPTQTDAIVATEPIPATTAPVDAGTLAPPADTSVPAATIPAGQDATNATAPTATAPITVTPTPTATTTPSSQSTTTTCSGKTNGNFTLPNGAIYQIQCGIAFFGSNIVFPTASSFDQCLSLCEDYNTRNGGGCLSISWVPPVPAAVAAGWQACSLKSSVPASTPYDQWEVDSAVLLVSGQSQQNTPSPAATPSVAPTPTPSPTPAPAGKSCEGLKEGTYSSSPTGAKYGVKCNIDLPGSDLSTSGASSFTDCIAACDTYNVARSGKCLGVAWVPGRLRVGVPSCYLKGGSLPPPTLQPYTVDIAVVTSQAPNPVCAGVPSGAFTSTTGSKYTVACSTDYAGSDIATPAVSTFTQCINACDSWNNIHTGASQCIGASWVPPRVSSGAPACYLKGGSLASTQYPSFEVDSVVLVQQGPPPTCQGVTNGQYTSSAGGIYQAACNTDYPGNDIATPTANSFTGCINACDAYNVQQPGQCIGASWVPSRLGTGAPACYLKGNQLPGPVYQSFEVDSVKLVQQAPTDIAPICTDTVKQNGTMKVDGISYTMPCDTVSQGYLLSLGMKDNLTDCMRWCNSYGADCDSVTWRPKQNYDNCVLTYQVLDIFTPMPDPWDRFGSDMGGTVALKNDVSGYKPLSAPLDPAHCTDVTEIVGRAYFDVPCTTTSINVGKTSPYGTNKFVDCMMQCSEANWCAGVVFDDTQDYMHMCLFTDSVTGTGGTVSGRIAIRNQTKSPSIPRPW